MQHHRTGTRDDGSQRGRAQVSRPARGRPDRGGAGGEQGAGKGEAAGVYRAAVRSVPPVFRTLLRPPGPRLTATGSGLLAASAMLCAGGFARWVLGTAPVFLGVVFLLVSACCALWVRPADAVAAPVALPIAFAVGMLASAPGTGLTAHVMAAATQLALEAPWLYGGTLLAAVVALLRHAALLAVRREARQPGAGAAPRA